MKLTDLTSVLPGAQLSDLIKTGLEVRSGVMAEPELGRKPLAIQRILSENVGNTRPRSYGRLATLETVE